MKTLRPFLYGKECRVLTDNMVVDNFKNQANLVGKYARWAMAINEFKELKTEHFPGSSNCVKIYMIVAVDYFFKFTVAKALRDAKPIRPSGFSTRKLCLSLAHLGGLYPAADRRLRLFFGKMGWPVKE